MRHASSRLRSMQRHSSLVTAFWKQAELLRLLHNQVQRPTIEALRRWVGRAILGNEIAPGLLDRYLAQDGYTGQLSG